MELLKELYTTTEMTVEEYEDAVDSVLHGNGLTPAADLRLAIEACRRQVHRHEI